MTPGRISHRIDAGIAEILLDAPPLNVLDLALMRELVEAVQELAPHPEPRALVLRSAQRAFSAGASVEEHLGDSAGPMIRTFDRLMREIESCPVPTVAVIGGAALGGGLELALACDFRIVAAEARLGLPEVQLGVFPPYAALRLPELIGQERALRLILGGQPVSGGEALALGLADRVVPRDELAATTEEFLATLARHSASTLRLGKAACLARRADRDAALGAIESIYLDQLMHTHDAEEGLRAFLEKREPKWLHR